MMMFYIVTPAYNALHWLQGCVRSIADQVCDGIEVHHHVQDGASTDGTAAWLESWQQQHADTPGYKLTFESVPDAGLYDAINIAWKKMPDDADITAHLNSDEQYLPGALAAVAAEMQKQPKADIAMASYMVLDKDFRYICHRRTSRPRKTVSRVICQLITCATFHRAFVFRKRGVYFDATYKSLADVVFFRDIMMTSPRVIQLPQVFTSIYVVTGHNVSWSDVTNIDKARLYAELPWYLVKLCPVFVKWNNMQYYVAEWLNESPREYAIYPAGAAERATRTIKHPTVKWGFRTEGEHD